MINSRSTVDSGELALFLGNAEAVINGKIVKQYALPLATIPPILQALSNEIGAYKYLSQKVFTAERKNDSQWVAKFKEAMGILDEIASGAIALVDADGGIIAGRTDAMEIWSNTKDFEPTFTEDAPEFSSIDGDKIKEIRDDRDSSGLGQ